MTKAFIHLSDIHFGQEKGGQLIVNNDVKERLIDDIAECAAKLLDRRAAGVIVTGDIAFSGKKEEYKTAGEWLDRVAAAAGCEITDIQVVPGNHDIDKSEISQATAWMLAQIVEGGEPKLDEFLESDRDREMLYGRFTAYRPFAEGYNSPLDKEGGGAGDRTIDLAPGRSLRFVGLNSAIICAQKDKPGHLLLGKRQRVLPKTAGQELIVLAHHPLHWFQDSDDASRYVRSRARVFISGHEHEPSVRVDPVEQGCDLLMLQAGATVPPTSPEVTYTYNILEFGWDAATDGLDVTVHPRAWCDERKGFFDDPVRLGGANPTFRLGCPHFRRAVARVQPMAGEVVEAFGESMKSLIAAAPADVGTQAGNQGPGEEQMSAQYPLLLLRFFRDLSPGQRLAVLVKLGKLPDDWPEPLTLAVERRVLDSLERAGKLKELEEAINNVEEK